MATGPIDPQSSSEMLFIASKTNLLGYGKSIVVNDHKDVENNRDLFDKEVTDGINCLAFGIFPPDPAIEDSQPCATIVAGGNCSLNGYDKVGDERFWTVTGDNVAALTFLDWDGDGVEELMVGSDDQSIRAFRGEELIHDIQEMSKISHLTRFGGNRQVFGYSLINGAFGVYNNKKRLWRQKSKEKITAMLGLEYDIDGQLVLIIGTSSGSVQARKHRTGELIHEVKMPTSIAAVFYCDYRQEGAQ